MTQEGGVPPGFWARVEQIAERVVARYARSGSLRNASTTDGGSYTIKGGVLRLINHLDRTIFYLGPMSKPLLDGTPQHGMIITRGDGTQALSLFDAAPGVDGLNQALNWFDRSGRIVLADDTDGGQGLARPWIPGVWGLARAQDWPSVTSTSWETVYRAKMPKQHPRLRMAVWGWNDTAGATGEMQVLVNDEPFGTVATTSNSVVGEKLFGPLPVVAAHMSELKVEVQARMVSGTGAVKLCPSTPPEGRQT